MEEGGAGGSDGTRPASGSVMSGVGLAQTLSQVASPLLLLLFQLWDASHYSHSTALSGALSPWLLGASLAQW